MNINYKDLALQIEPPLKRILSQHLAAQDTNTHQFSTLNFRDRSYSATSGGYHPVEIGINHDGTISYITDFSYIGIGCFAELVKELDFDFSSGTFGQHGRICPIESAIEIFQLWQQNFCHYYKMGIYDVTSDQH